ncbi:amino acid permease, partial [Actinomadura sp. GC306]
MGLLRRLDARRPAAVHGLRAPLTAVVSILAVGWLMVNLKVQTWAYFGVWMLAGLLLY